MTIVVIPGVEAGLEPVQPRFDGLAQPRRPPLQQESVAPPPPEIRPLPAAAAPATAPATVAAAPVANTPVFSTAAWKAAVADLSVPRAIRQGKTHLVLTKAEPRLWLGKVTSGPGVGKPTGLVTPGGLLTRKLPA